MWPKWSLLTDLYQLTMVGGYVHEGKKDQWANFDYFIKKMLPVCEEAQVRLTLHPNDPPSANRRWQGLRRSPNPSVRRILLKNPGRREGVR